MRIVITGADGFVGSNLRVRLHELGHTDVVGVTRKTSAVQLQEALQGADFVFHLAANADVRFGPDHPRRDLEQNTIVTWNVLEAMRAAGVRRIAFASTGSVYGEPEIFPTPETAPFPVQTSLYAASKLAAEGMIAAYVAAFGYQAYIFRFVSILGERYTHGHVLDFYRQLL